MLVNKPGETATWNFGHYTDTGTLAWQGGSYAPIDDVVNDINRFTRDNPELVILEISHVNRIFINGQASSTRRGPTEEEWQPLWKSSPKSRNAAPLSMSTKTDANESVSTTCLSKNTSRMVQLC
jgi:hypothetical protein